ncbi:DMT family transporter [[Clostridium] symbiosum]|uniref:DMT family transporter n=1 Tax=Clostridium symbiosum TaxID=1512 RepID=UPI00214BE406|nr:DMT family transporter [[Clostridium] symbiosum]MCR1942366.1 DMT family transporter [[Clostridium] symbiosum]
MKFLEKHPMYMIATGVVGISLSAIIVKYSDAPSLITAVYRLFFTVAMMTPVVFLNRSFRMELSRVSLRTVVLCAVSGIFLALHFVSWFESLAYTSVASSTVIVCTESIWVALGFCFLLRGRLKKKAVLSIAVTFAGSILIAMSDYGSGSSLLKGDLLALFAAVMVAAYTLLGRIVRADTSTTVYTYIVYFFCGLSLFAAALITRTPLTGYGSSSLLCGLLLAICSTLLGHSVFSWCLKYLSPAFVSSSKLCEPPVASLFAMILFGEIPSLLQISGGIIILAGVIYYSRLETAA